jgi:tellurite resistance-related uncharacterized protein
LDERVHRSITGFRLDEVGDWVAQLDCLHAQHVRHRPPFILRPWVQSASGRLEHIATPLDCPLCDRAELPAGLVVVRTAGPFDERTLPPGLRRDHRVAAGTWAVVRVLTGSAVLTIRTEPLLIVDLRAGDMQPIPPDVPHALALDDGSVDVDFLLPAPAASGDASPLAQPS